MEFDHIAQVVPHIAEAIEWYAQTFGGVEILHQDASWGFISMQGTKMAFVLKDEHPNHIAWRVSALELEAMSQKFGQPIKDHRDKTRSFYLEAPGGTHLEIITFEGSDWVSEP